MTLAAGVTLGLLVVAAPAAGKGPEIDGYGDGIYLTNAWDGAVDRAFTYGRDEDRLFVGNWDGRGGDTLAVREERTSRGISPVTAVPALRPVALRHSQWMAEEGVIEHGSSATIRREAEAVGCTAGGEHIVRTYQRGGADPDPRDAMDSYMNSAVHRRGILNPNNTHVAVATVKAGDLVYSTQRFVRNC